MAEPKKINFREWIETALAIGTPTCDIHKETLLELRYIEDQQGNLITWYIECPTCCREYSFLMSFHPLIIKERRR